MVTAEQIQHLTDDIVRQFAPERVILFGSYAYGVPTPDSDVDLLVVLPPFTERSVVKTSEVRQAVHAGFPMDVLAYSSDYLQNRLEKNDFFCAKLHKRAAYFMTTLTAEWVT